MSYSFFDIFEFSCLNGWGFGNIAATAMDISKFWYQYMGTENFLTDSMK